LPIFDFRFRFPLSVFGVMLTENGKGKTENERHFMNCPACHVENPSEAVVCSACGRPLQNRPARRSASRRRTNDAAEAAAVDSNNPAAWRAYRVSLWSIVPGLGLLLGPVAAALAYRAVCGAGDDYSARNRARAALVFGIGSTLTQWLGILLIYFCW
jgi:hypothetical protein